jgi:hypothetical protein
MKGTKDFRPMRTRCRRPTLLPEGLEIDTRKCTVEIVQQAIYHRFGYTLEQIATKNRQRIITYPRQMLLYFLSVNTDYCSRELAGVTDRDHATIFASRNRIEGYMELYKDTRDDIMEIAENIEWLHQLDKEIVMNEVPTSRIRYMYFLLDQLGIRSMKNDLVLDASEKRTESVRELTKLEMDALIKHLEQKLHDAQKSAGPHKQSYAKMDKMRKRIFSICYTIGWTTIDPDKNTVIVDQERLNAWLLKYGYLHKDLMDYTYLELPTLVTQFERLLRSTLESFKS